MVDDADEVPEGTDLDDLGEPLVELRDLAEPPSPALVARIRSSLRRRSLASQLASLGWSGVGSVFLEFIEMIRALLVDTTSNRGGPR
jgi:hypothetical protein